MFHKYSQEMTVLMINLMMIETRKIWRHNAHPQFWFSLGKSKLLGYDIKSFNGLSFESVQKSNNGYEIKNENTMQISWACNLDFRSGKSTPLDNENLLIQMAWVICLETHEIETDDSSSHTSHLLIASAISEVLNLFSPKSNVLCNFLTPGWPRYSCCCLM